MRVWPAASEALPTPSATENPAAVPQAPPVTAEPQPVASTRSKSSLATNASALTDTCCDVVAVAPKLSVTVSVTV